MNLNARLYNPYLGRFLSPDPIFDPKGDIFGFNPYIYGNNNPCSFVDPDGKFAEWAIFALAIAFGTSTWMSYCHTGNLGQAVLQGFISAAACYANTLLVPQCILAGVTSGAAIGGLAGGLSSVCKGNSFFGSDFWIGAFSGAVSGAKLGYKNAKAHGRNVWNGNIEEKVGKTRTTFNKYYKDGMARSTAANMDCAPASFVNEATLQQYSDIDMERVEEAANLCLNSTGGHSAGGMASVYSSKRYNPDGEKIKIYRNSKNLSFYDYNKDHVKGNFVSWFDANSCAYDIGRIGVTATILDGNNYHNMAVINMSVVQKCNWWGSVSPHGSRIFQCLVFDSQEGCTRIIRPKYIDVVHYK